MRTIFCAIAAILLAAPALGAGMDGKRACVDLTVSGNLAVVNAQTMESSRTFVYNGDNRSGGYDLLVLWVELTDANTTITDFRTTVTVSRDANVTDNPPQIDVVDTVTGISTQVDAGVWKKESPGSKSWPVRANIQGYPDFQVTFSVAAGTGEAGDLLTAYARVCTEGG